MRVRSWNINGLRAAMKKGLPEWLASTRPDLVGLQEVRAQADQITDELAALAPWSVHLSCAERKGYSGTALVSRAAPDAVTTSIGDDAMDAEGRVQLARFGRLHVVNVYVPNGNGRERDNSRVPFKLSFQRRLFDVLAPLVKRGERVLVMGDINTAPQAIDLARPKENAKTSGFLPEERDEVARWLAAGWVDTFRAFEPGPGHYSWWSARFGVREKNIGWRIDLALASPALVPFVRAAVIEREVRGSDHAPIGVDLDDAVLR
ncbi:MAG: exodeoxyribonuclease III [Deltaproteobacteria bacterium]|nr:exodeoxyribonuclease III [Deltaproteobacteria bacterium]